MNMTAVFIVAIVCWALVEITTGRRDKKKRQNQQQDHAQWVEQLQALKARIETLEKIVTDEKYDLNKQFDELKKDKVA